MSVTFSKTFTVIIYYTLSSLYLGVSDDVAITEQTNFIEKTVWIIPICSGQMAPTRGGGGPGEEASDESPNEGILFLLS
jgi:hypothetical protein